MAIDIQFSGIYIANKYIFNTKLNGNEKIILGFLSYINKYAPGEIITSNYLSKKLSISTSTIDKTLKKLEAEKYIKIKMVTYKNMDIKLGKIIEVLK